MTHAPDEQATASDRSMEHPPASRWWRRLGCDDTTAFALGLIAVVVAVHAWWLRRFRTGMGLEQDEARILLNAYRLLDASPDPLQLARAWKGTDVVAPGLPLLAVPVIHATSSSVALVAWTILPFVALLLMAVFVLARHLGGRVSGLVALVITAAVPGIAWFARVYEQIIPGSALWAATIACLVRSDHLRSRPWRLGAGIALGVALVTRAMVIGFLPALVVALAVQWLALPARQRPRWSHVLQFAGLALGIAATWWWFQWSTTLDYFRDAGYGTPVYAANDPGFSLGWSRWTSEWDLVVRLLGGALPALTLIGVGVLGVAAAVLAGKDRPRAGWVRRVAATPEAFVGIVVVAGFVTLVTSDQDFAGYGLINLPLAIALVASAARYRWVRYPIAGAGLVFAVVTPTLLGASAGWMPITAYGNDRGLTASDTGWTEVGEQTMAICADLAARDGRVPVVGSAVNRVLYGGDQLAVDGATSGRGAIAFNINDGFDATLDDQLADLNCVVTAGPGSSNAGYVLDVPAVEAALRSAGFTVVRTVPLPDGADQKIWWKDRGRPTS